MQARPFSSPAPLKALPQFLVSSVLAALAWVTTTTHAQRQAILDWVDGGHRLDLFLTLHNTEAADFIEGPPATQPLANRFWKLLVDGTSFYSPRGPRMDTAGTTTPGMKGRMSVNQALFHERRIPAFLMELMVDTSPKLSRPPTVQDRLEFGTGLVRAMCAAVEEPAR